jgi:hypothetical protein
LFPFALNFIIWNLTWLPQCKVGGKSGFTSKIRKTPRGIAPFDVNKELKKLATWDSPPTEDEMEDIKPLLACIQALKSGSGGALLGTQLMSFFLQRRVQPLKHHVSKLWTYSGLKDSSRVSEEDIEKKDLDK